MTWIAVGVFVAIVATAFLRSSRPKPPRLSSPTNPSVIVEMDDQPPAEIDFEAGIRANQKAKGDATLE